MFPYQFRIGNLEAGNLTCSTLVFHSVPHTHDLHIKVLHTDAQQFAVELAGLPTPRLRMADMVQRVADSFHAKLAHVVVRRGASNLVEMVLVLEAFPAPIEMPVPFADGVALALQGKLPIYGEQSIASLLRPVEAEEETTLPAFMTSFLQSLSD